MHREDSYYPLDWLRIAEKDLTRVERLLAWNDPEDAGFHLQQAGEKTLKAYLLSKGWRLRRIHDLEVLLNDALEHAPSLEAFREICQKVTDYYKVERYPFTTPSALTLEEVRHSFEETKRLIEKIRGLMSSEEKDKELLQKGHCDGRAGKAVEIG